MEKIYNYDIAIENREVIIDKIKAPYVAVQVSTLGGKENTNILITISLDKKETWQNKIIHNSRYYQFHIDIEGYIENFNRNYKLDKIRKKKIKTINEAIEYINNNIQGV